MPFSTPRRSVEIAGVNVRGKSRLRRDVCPLGTKVFPDPLLRRRNRHALSLIEAAHFRPCHASSLVSDRVDALSQWFQHNHSGTKMPLSGSVHPIVHLPSAKTVRYFLMWLSGSCASSALSWGTVHSAFVNGWPRCRVPLHGLGGPYILSQKVFQSSVVENRVR